MSEHEKQPAPYDRPSDEEMRRGCAFFVAPVAGTMLFVGTFALYRELPALLREPKAKKGEITNGPT